MIVLLQAFGLIITFATLLTWGVASLLNESVAPKKKRRRAMRTRREELYKA